MSRKQWNTLLIWVTIALILVCAFSPAAWGQDFEFTGPFLKKVEPERYRVLITFTMTDEKVCALPRHNVIESCKLQEETLQGMAAWHGQNIYECVLDSQCPSD